MAVTVTAQRLDSQTYRCTAAGMTPGATLYWYRNARLIESSVRTSIITSAPPGERIAIFVSDDPNAVPDIAYPGHAFLTWYLSAGAAVFRVDKWVVDEWVEQSRIPVSPLQYIYQWVSPLLDDVTLHRFRVVPITAANVEGFAREFQVYMVRWPDVPDAEFTLDIDLGTLTVGTE